MSEIETAIMGGFFFFCLIKNFFRLLFFSRNVTLDKFRITPLQYIECPAGERCFVGAQEDVNLISKSLFNQAQLRCKGLKEPVEQT